MAAVGRSEQEYMLCAICSEELEFPDAYSSRGFQKQTFDCCSGEDGSADLPCDLCLLEWSKIFKTCHEHGVRYSDNTFNQLISTVARDINRINNDEDEAEISTQWDVADLKLLVEKIYSASSKVFRWNNALESDLMQTIGNNGITILTELKNFVDSHSSNPVVEEDVMAEAN